MKTTLIINDVRYVEYPLEEGKIILLAQALADPAYARKFLTLDELLYTHKHFSDFKTLFSSQGKILGEIVGGKEHVCSSLWWSGNTVGINETTVAGTLLPGKKGNINYLLVRKS